MIEIVKAPPFATVQDLGWRTGRAMGLPQGGAMDPALLEEANALVGNPVGCAGIEWALGPGTLRFLKDTVVCVMREAEVRIEGVTHAGGPIHLTSRTVLEIAPGKHDRFLYVAVRGGIDVPQVMGSRSTYLPGAMGGFEGRRLKTGDELTVGAPPKALRRSAAARERGSSMSGVLQLRVTRGPQWERFDAQARASFFSGEYTVAPASDRMGYRLNGPVVNPRETATLPSEAACPGAVQIPDGGEPIVLMPDGPTVGGYPKLAVVIRADLGKLAQSPPGRRVRFLEVTLEEARAAGR